MPDEHDRVGAPLTEAPDEASLLPLLVDSIQEALNPTAETVNIGLARLGARRAVMRIVASLRDPKLAPTLAAFNPRLIIKPGVTDGEARTRQDQV